MVGIYTVKESDFKTKDLYKNYLEESEEVVKYERKLKQTFYAEYVNKEDWEYLVKNYDKVIGYCTKNKDSGIKGDYDYFTTTRYEILRDIMLLDRWIN